MEISNGLPIIEISSQEPRKLKEAMEESELQEDIPSKSPAIYKVTNPIPPLPGVLHARDDDFTTQIWRVKSEIQTGRVPGHYLKINGGRVSADATRTDKKAQFKIHCYYDDILKVDMWIFESASDDGKIIAIENDRVVVKCIKTALTSILHVQATHPEILFIKKPLGAGSEVFTLRLYSTSSTKYFLGFDKYNGTVMVPSKVRPNQKEAKFRIF